MLSLAFIKVLDIVTSLHLQNSPLCLRMCPELKVGIQIDICTPMFTVTLFPITKRWKQSKYSLMDEMDTKM